MASAFKDTFDKPETIAQTVSAERTFGTVLKMGALGFGILVGAAVALTTAPISAPVLAFAGGIGGAAYGIGAAAQANGTEVTTDGQKHSGLSKFAARLNPFKN